VLDLKWIRENPEPFLKGLKAKGVALDPRELLDLDTQRRTLLHKVEQLKAQRNTANQEISRLKAEGGAADATIAQMKIVSQKIKDIDLKVGDIDKKIADLLLMIPNTPHESVPVGPGNSANKVVRIWGEPRKLAFKGRDHLDLATERGWLSMEAGSKVTGSAFPVYRGMGARLERALINLMIDFHVKKHGFEEVWPPALVNRAAMTGTGQLPKLEADMYRLEQDDLFLIPTAEVPVTNLYREQMILEENLPVKMVAYTPCFRREAGSYGKDTRGLSRVHQFDKVEMVKLVRPEDSLNELESLVACAEAILQTLELPYRVVLLGSGDMSFAAAKCYDLEVWAPVTGRWFEVSSCSTFGDFQARRMNARFRRKSTNKPEFVHTLNGSGVALARVVLCLLENFQTAEGQVTWPKALKPYLDGPAA
jgi:seryl-tRNA synthetase